jgi:hypothetical protein
MWVSLCACTPRVCLSLFCESVNGVAVRVCTTPMWVPACRARTRAHVHPPTHPQESWLLDIWTNERVQQIGGVLSLVVFAIVIASVGPPPSDSRCTLPWC